MTVNIKELIDRLEKEHSLSIDEYRIIIDLRDPETAEYAAEKAVKTRKQIYGNSVFIRGLIEVSNVCRNDCFYCGIRRSNDHCERYSLTDEQILECCSKGHEIGFRTFVMQGGESHSFSAERVCRTVQKIKAKFADCAVTLSLGEYKREEYKAMREAGADRFLLRHETADKEHYEKLHPSGMSFDNRMECLRNLKDLGFQTGCGFMVGSPYQTSMTLAKDLKFIEVFKPEMCGIGPFIPHKDTPFRDMPAGPLDLTCYLLSLIRLICPKVLLPATTALGTIDPFGRQKGILSGANVVMPNLSPEDVRDKYRLYNNKLYTGCESAQQLNMLSDTLRSIGYDIVIDRGDAK